MRRLLALGLLLLLQTQISSGAECSEGYQDIYFLVESSLGVPSTAFQAITNFIRNVAKTMEIGQKKNRISLTIFNKDVEDRFGLDDSSNYRTVSTLLARADYNHGSTHVTNLGKAMQYMADNKFNDSAGRRPDQHAVCVIIMEGSSSDYIMTSSELLRNNCRVMTLGIIRSNYYELSRIVSNPISGHIRTMVTFNDLARHVNWLSTTICEPPVVAMRMQRGVVKHDAIQITWILQPYAVRYIVHLRLAGVSKPIAMRNLKQGVNNITFKGLKEATSYSIDAWAVGRDQKKADKSVLFVSSGIKVPDVVLDPLSVTKETAVVRWKAIRLPGVTYYITVRELGSRQFIHGTTVAGNEFEITRLRAGVSYSVELMAMHRGVRSEGGTPLVFHTVPDPPLPKIKFVTDKSVRIYWKQMPGADSYGIRTYDTESSEFELLVRVDETKNLTFHVSPLLSGKQYKFTLTSKTVEGLESEEGTPVFERIAPSNPRFIRMDSRKNTSIGISWDAQEGVYQYTVQYKLSTAADYMVRRTNGTKFFADGLLTGAVYVFRVFSVGEGSRSDTENPGTIRIETVPAKIEGVSIQTITENSVTLKWSLTRGAKIYILTFTDADSGKLLKSERVQDKEATIGGLLTGVTYLITVAAETEGKIVGEASDAQVVVTLPGVPSAPTIVDSSNTTLTLKWEAVTGAVQYVIQIREKRKEKGELIRTRNTLFTIEGLRTGTWYVVSLKSVGTGGRINNEPSESVEFQTVPAIPGLGRLVSNTHTSLTMTWKEVKGAVGYIVTVRPWGSDVILQSVNSTENTKTIRSLKSGETYAIRLRTFGGDGYISEESDVTMMKTMPHTPGKPRVITVSSSTVTLEWDEVKGASGYEISISDKIKLSQIRTEDIKFQIMNLKPSTQYSFALYSIGMEGIKNPKEGPRVEAMTAPRLPGDMRVLNAETTYIELSWIAVRGAVSYIVRYKSIEEDEGLYSGEVEAKNPNFQTVSKLQPGVLYEFSLIAVGSDGSRSDPVTLVDGTLPNPPDKPLVLLIGSTSATLSWNDAKGAISYIVKARAKNFEKEVKSNTTKVSIDGLQSGSRYDFTVLSVGINNRVNYYESEKQRDQTITSSPTNVALGESTTTTIELSWDKMIGAVYYTISVKLTDGELVQKYLAFSTKYTVKRLSPGVQYTFLLTSVGSNFLESQFSKPLVVTTVPTSPETPELIELMDTWASFEWQPAEGAESYIFVVEKEGAEDKKEVNVTKSKIKVESLKPGTWYNFYVYSVGTNERINEKPSEKIREQTVPATPEKISLVNATTSSVTLKWNAVDGVENYEIYLRHGDVSNDIVKTIITTNTVHKVSPLDPGIRYTFSVTAVGVGGRKSKESSPISSSTFTNTPTMPFLRTMTSTSAALEWDPVPGAVRYILYYVDRKKNERKSREVTEPQVVVDGLGSGTWYDFSVVSIGSGEKPSEESEILDDQTTPSSPANVRIHRVGMDYITVVWDKSKGASSYKLTRKWSNEVNEIQQMTSNTDQTSMNFANLSPGTEYEIVIQAISHVGRFSENSPELVENTIPSSPEIPELVEVTSSMIHISWKEVKGAASYVVKISPAIGEEFYRETTQPEFIESSLQPGKWFAINVQARDKKNRGNGIESPTLDVQTVSLRPTKVKILEIGTNSMKFDWNQMDGADFYVVTATWSVKNSIINTFGAQEVTDGEIILWEGEKIKKKDGLKTSKEEQYNIVPSQVAVKDDSAWFQLQTRSNKIEINGLDPATHYSFQFQSVNEEGRASPGKVVMNDTTLPSKIDFLSLIGITDTSAAFAWDSVKGIDMYIVNITNQSNGKVKSVETTDATLTLRDLNPGTWYDVEIYTVGVNGRMNYDSSDVLSFQTVPSPPQNFEITEVDTTSMVLTWDESEGVNYYRITIRLTRPFRAIFRTEIAQKNTHRVEKLTPGSTYLFTVVSVATGGRESRPSRLMTDTTTPATIKDLRLIDMTSTAATLQWTDVPGGIKFIVHVKGDDATTTQQETRGTVITIEDLKPGVWYEFWINSVGTRGRINEKESNIIRQQTVPLPPRNLQVEEVTTSTIELSWQKVHGIKQYQVYLEEEEDPTGETLEIFNVTRSSFTVTQLTSGVSYSISVVAVGTSGQISEKSLTIVQATAPASLDEILVKDVTTNLVEISWNEITGAILYTVIMRLPGESKVLRSIDTRQSSHIVSPLQPGTTYVFSVAVTGSNGKKSAESPQVLVQTVPLSPSGIVVEEVTTASIELTWKPVTGVKLYKIEISKKDDPTGTIFRTDEVQKVRHTVGQLNSGTTYLFSIITVGTSGRESEDSEVITQTTLPARPMDMQLLDITTTTITFKWSHVVGALFYTVHVSGDDGTSKQFNTPQPQATVQKLSPGVWYEMYVVSNGKQSRNPQPSETLREQTIPLSPSKLLVTNSGTTSISFQWEPVIGVKFYEVEIRQTQEDSASTLQTFIADDTDHTVSQLIPGVSYTVTVTAVGTSGRKSSPSDPLRQTTVPAALDEIMVTEATTTSIGLHWYKVIGASMYRIVVRLGSDPTGAILDEYDTTSTSYRVSELIPGETYLFSIKSKGFGGKMSRESPQVESQTVPLPPSDLRIVEVGTTSIALKWTRTKGAEFYRLVTKNEAGEISKTDEVRSTEHKVAGLSPGMQYLFTITSVGTSGRESEVSEPIPQNTKPSSSNGVILSDVKTTSMLVQWNSVTGAARYKVISRNTETETDESFSTRNNRYILSDLEMGTDYQVIVVAIGSDGLESGESSPAVEQTVPATPTKLKLIYIRETSASFRWNKVKGAVGYVVLVKEPAFGNEIRIETNDTEITLEDLSPGTDYEFSVLSVGTNDRVNHDESEKLVEQTVSSPTEGVQVESATTSSVLITWSSAPGVDVYILKVRDHATRIVLETFEISKLRHLVEGLQPGKNYSFTVTSVAKNGRKSEESYPIVASTTISTPNKPLVTMVTSSSVSMNWPEVQGAREYIVHIHDMTRNTMDQKKAEEESAMITKLSPGYSYSFSISAVGSSGIASEAGESVTTETIPEVPQILGVNTTTSNSISFFWNDVKGSTRYVIRARWGRSRKLNVTTPLLSNMNSYELELPFPGTDYGITIIAEGKNGLSDESEILKENTLPLSPEQPSVVDVSSDSASLSWKPVIGATSYEVVIKQDKSEDESFIVYRPAAQLNDLKPGYWYEITLYSRDAKQRVNREGSDPLRLQAVPNSPLNINVKDVKVDSMSLAWKKVYGAKMYEVSVQGREEQIVEFAKTWQNVEIISGEVTFNIRTIEPAVTVTGLMPGCTFKLKVLSVGEEESRSEPIEIQATTLPATVEDIIVKEVTTSSAVLKWQELRGVSFYLVDVTNKRGIHVTSHVVQQPTITIKELTAGTWYNVTIATYDVFNRTNGVPSKSVNFQTVSQQIKNVESSDVTTDSITITWENVKGAVSYLLKIYWYAESVSSNHLPSDGSKGRKGVAFKSFQTPLTKVTVNQLEPGNEYWYEVVALTAQGRSSQPSERKNDTTLPVGVSKITVLSVTQTSISLSWEDVKGAQKYSVEITAPDGESEGLVQKTAFSDIMFTGLVPGVWYDVIVLPLGEKGRRNTEGSANIKVKTTPLPPSEVTIVTVTQKRISLTWTASRGAVRYRVVADYVDTHGSQSFTHDTSELSHRFTLLQPGVMYSIHVISFGGSGDNTASEKSDVVMQRTVLEAPGGLKVTEFTEDSITLTWEPSTGATSYIVSITNILTGESSGRDVGNEVSSEITDLEPGTIYTFTVKAKNKDDNLMSIESEAAQQRTRPSAPQLLRITDVDSTTISLRWQRVEGAETYTIYISEMGLIGSEFKDRTLNTITIDELKPGTNYNVQVTAVTVEGIESGESEMLKQMTAPTTPNAPVVRHFTSDSVELEWRSIRGVNSYIVIVKDVETGDVTELEAGSSLTFEIYELQPGTVYSFSIRGEEESKDLRSEESDEVEQRTSPSAPENLRVISRSTEEITLQWDPVNGARTYTVFWKQARSKDTEQQQSNIRRTELVVSGLESGFEYEFQVIAVTVEDLKSERSEKIRQSTAPNSPTMVGAIDVEETSFSIAWKPAEGATSYILSLTNMETSEKQEFEVGNTLEYVLENLEPGTQYSVYVVALTLPDNLRSDASSTIVQRTLPASPQNAIVFEVTEDTVSLEWDVVKGATSYTVFISKAGDAEATERQIKDLEENVVKVERLLSGSLYKFNVISVTEDGLKSRKTKTIKQQTIPAAPQDVTVSNITAASMRVNWQQSEGATSYTVKLVKDETLEEKIVTVEDDQTAVFRRLEPGVVYIVTVNAVIKNKDMVSKDSYRVLQRTLPPVPENLQVVAVTSESVTLEWEESIGAETYTLYFYELKKSGNRLDDGLMIDFIESTSIEVIELEPGKQYEFQILAVSPEGLESEESGSIFEATRFTAPELPKSGEPFVRLSKPGTTFMKASWDEVPDAVSYTIFVRSDDEEERILSDIESTRMRLNDLTPDTLYYVTLVAIGKSGDETKESDPPAEMRTYPLPPDVPTELDSSDVTESSFVLSWEPAARALYYVIEMYDPIEDEHELITDVEDTEYTVEDLPTGKTFTFRVIAVGKFENSSKSKPFRGGARYAVPVMYQYDVSPVQASDITWNAFTVYFPVIDDAVTYIVMLRTKGKVYREIKKVKETIFRVRNLTQRTDFEVTYLGVGKGGYKTPESSPPLVVSTLSRTPSIPKGVKASNPTAESVTVEWEPSERAITYEVMITSVATSIPLFYQNVTSPYNAEGLTFDEAYTVSVLSVGKHDKSDLSKPVKFKTTVPKPGSIRIIDSQLISHDEILLSWSPAQYALSYTVTVTLNDKPVATKKEILGNGYRILNLKPSTTYKIGVKPSGLLGAMGEVTHKFFTTLPEPGEVPGTSDINEFGIDETLVDEPNEEGSGKEIGLMHFARPTNMEESLSSLLVIMMDIPQNEITYDGENKEIIKKSSPFRKNLLRHIQITWRIAELENLEKNEVTLPKQQEAGEMSESMEKLILMSQHLRADPKRLGRSGALKVAREISGLLVDIFSTLEEGELGASGEEDLQEVMTPLLEGLLLDIILGDLEVTVDTITSRGIALSWKGRIPSNTIDFRIREEGSKKFLKTITVDSETTTVKFTKLESDTNYEIFIVPTGKEKVLYSTTVTTERGVFIVPPPIPKNTRAQFIARTYIAVRWEPVPGGKGNVVYVVRLYNNKGREKPLMRFRMQSATTKYITKLKPKTTYKVTVSSYDLGSKLQSKESRPLEVRTK